MRISSFFIPLAYRSCSQVPLKLRQGPALCFRRPTDATTASGDTGAGPAADILPTVAVAASVTVAAVTITWADGTVTTVYPPETPVRPAGATPRQLAARVSSRVPDMARNAVEKESRPPPSGGRLSVLGTGWQPVALIYLHSSVERQRAIADQAGRNAKAALGKSKRSGTRSGREAVKRCAPGRIRTRDPLLRRQPLYPTELLALGDHCARRRSRVGHAEVAVREGSDHSQYTERRRLTPSAHHVSAFLSSLPANRQLSDAHAP